MRFHVFACSFNSTKSRPIFMICCKSNSIISFISTRSWSVFKMWSLNSTKSGFGCNPCSMTFSSALKGFSWMTSSGSFLFWDFFIMIIITKNTHRFRNYSVVALLTSSSLFKIKLMFGFFGLIFFIVILSSFCEKIFKINDIRVKIRSCTAMGSAGYFFFIRLSNFTQQIIVVVIVFAIMTFDLVREVWLISKISSEFIVAFDFRMALILQESRSCADKYNVCFCWPPEPMFMDFNLSGIIKRCFIFVLANTVVWMRQNIYILGIVDVHF